MLVGQRALEICLACLPGSYGYFLPYAAFMQVLGFRVQVPLSGQALYQPSRLPSLLMLRSGGKSSLINTHCLYFPFDF